MADVTLSAKLRTEDFGSAGSRRLVRAGRIPAVVYGKGENVHVSIDARTYTLNKKAFKGEFILSVEGEKDHKVVIKAVQNNLLKGVISHMDFYEV
ncbi:MAG: hypothetical protein J6R23_07005 [Spirochaetales bacterium]|nr:hypothetical protein [Spirochaetales bacterium]MBQ2258784.1 hypothetical protein [Spirochaetales bacterium]